MIATYRKLANGNWGVAVSIALAAQQNVTPAPGLTITVSKRNGDFKTETLGAQVGAYEGWLAFEIDRPAAPAVIANVGNTSAIYKLFDKAKQNLKFPAVELSVPGFDAIRISVAGERAREPGSLTVTSIDKVEVEGRDFPQRRWFGRISTNGDFQVARGLDGAFANAINNRLAAFAADPSKVGGEEGHLTGNCCFCRKALTDERSTLAGYGAKCAKNWGLAWGDRPSSFACAAE